MRFRCNGTPKAQKNRASSWAAREIMARESAAAQATGNPSCQVEVTNQHPYEEAPNRLHHMSPVP
eukprot:751035-Amphidinium_carterae.1